MTFFLTIEGFLMDQYHSSYNEFYVIQAKKTGLAVLLMS